MTALICMIHLERNYDKYWNDYDRIISDILLTTKNNALMQSTAKYCEVLYGNAKYCKNSKYSIHLKKQFQLFTLRVFQYR